MGTCICVTCGNHFPDPCPEICAVCADERQWVPPGGQRWTTQAELAAAGHRSDMPYRFDRIYGGWWAPVLRSGGWEIVRSSALRYVEHLEGVA